MPSFPKPAAGRRTTLLALSVVLSAAVPALAADVEKDLQAADFLDTFVRNSAAALPAGGAGCLSQSEGATFGREVAAILNGFADSAANIVTIARCEPEEGGAQHCTLSFSVTEGEEQASAGFTFSLQKSGGAIDLNSARCFQTP